MVVFSILATAQAPRAFSVVEATIPEMQRAMREGRTTSRELVRSYLARIGTYDHLLHAVLAVNPKALEEAALRDRERARGHVRGPLHGIPVALKDNIQTTMMPTTGGALAFERFVPPYEATLVGQSACRGRRHHREDRHDRAGELGGRRSDADADQLQRGRPASVSTRTIRGAIRATRRSTDGPALQTGGSSSGIGTSASFWAANVGTETSGSILSPSNQNMLAGIKPTVGRISRYGVIPITADQDTAGPMARTVTDAAIMLGALESASPDPHDPATRTCTPPPGRNYTRFLRAGALKGARIGIPRAFFYDRVAQPGTTQGRRRRAAA